MHSYFYTSIPEIKTSINLVYDQDSQKNAKAVIIWISLTEHNRIEPNREQNRVE